MNNKSVILSKGKKISPNENDGDYISFRRDTIEIFGNFRIKNCFLMPSLQGEILLDSNYETFEGFDVDVSTRASQYKFKIIFKRKGYSCIEYHEGTQINPHVTTRNHFTFTGMASKLMTQEEIDSFIDNYVLFEEYRRFDIAIDLPYKLSSVKGKFGKLKQKGADFYGSQGQTMTYYIGEYKKSENRYKLIRMYDKIASIKKLKQQKYYTNYLQYRHVTRIEIEFREELCKGLTLENSRDIQYLKDLFFSNIKKHTNIFEDFGKKNISLTRSKKTISLDELSPEEIETSSRLRMFKGLGRNLKEAGICPVELLTCEKLYHDDTMASIALSTDEGVFSFKDFLSQKKFLANVKTLFNNLK